MGNDFHKEISSRNEGEGSKSAAKAYNKERQVFVKGGKVDAAEAKGGAHSHGEDPALGKKSTKH